MKLHVCDYGKCIKYTVLLTGPYYHHSHDSTAVPGLKNKTGSKSC